MKRSHLRKLGPEELKEANISDEFLRKDYDSLCQYDGRYIGCTALAWAYQKGRLEDNEFDFLFTWKAIDSGHHTDNQYWFRSTLVDRMQKDLEKYFTGQEVKPLLRRAKKMKPTKQELKKRQVAARKKLREELRAKRQGVYHQRG